MAVLGREGARDDERKNIRDAEGEVLREHRKASREFKDNPIY